MERRRKLLCVTVFLALCTGMLLFLLLFLLQFMNADSPICGYVTWTRSEIVETDGTSRPLDLSGESGVPQLAEGAYFLFEGTIDHFPDDGYLIFEPAGMEIALAADGEIFYRSTLPKTDVLDLSQALHLPVPQEKRGGTFTVSAYVYALDTTGTYLFPPLMRIGSTAQASTFEIASVSRYAIFAGAYALGFVAMCGLFLHGMAVGQTDWGMLLLAVATALLTLRQVLMMSGYYFLPDVIVRFLNWNWIPPVVFVLLLVYLLRRKRAFWRQLGWFTLGSALILAIVYLMSDLQGGAFARELRFMCSGLLYGQYTSVFNWLTIYLATACCCIADYGLLRGLIQTLAENRALALRNQLIMDNYRAVEQGITRTAELRHEWKNQLTALDLLYRQGDLKRLGARLGELRQEIDQLAPPHYSDCFVVDALLQNAAIRAAREQVRFQAHAPLPERLSIDERDLCSLLNNLLDNAFEAAAQVDEPQERFVSISLQLNQGYLAVSCRNSYNGTLLVDENGRLRTTKPDKENHGFGLRQLETIAGRYASKLELSYDQHSFTAQTALKLKKAE